LKHPVRLSKATHIANNMVIYLIYV
jgi:hypothetical protein